MKRLLFLAVPLLLVLLAFRPIRYQVVQGSVVDTAGSAIPFATVVVKGDGATTAADSRGLFSIRVTSLNAVLLVSASGYTTIELPLKGRSSIRAVLRPVTEKYLSETVVRGHAQRKDGVRNAYALPAPSTGMIYDRSIRGESYYTDKREQDPVLDREGYDYIRENRFQKVTDNPLSTFSIDVDGASYSNVRRMLQNNQLPNAGAVRIEEFVNYFKYDYKQPAGEHPFSIHTEISDAPWKKEHRLVLIGLQGRQIPVESLPASNLVFLIDVSGSMQSPQKLPLVRSSLKLLVEQLRPQDRISIVVYAGAAGMVLPPTAGSDKQRIREAIDRLEAGGSTAGGAGIRLAYRVAREQFMKGGNNRVILCSDGDFNVGESSDDAMERLIETERRSGVFLTVLGYGMGNYQDAKMQKLANKGNGNHAYIDGILEAKKVLVNEFGGTLFTIAKDVKLQVEFNPAKVQGYRLIGYENRMLAREDFNDDQKDAGELGSGHTVTALYEIIPTGIESDLLATVDSLKYQRTRPAAISGGGSDEILTVKFRYKAPDGDVSRLIVHPVKDTRLPIARTSDNFRFAAAVTEFGLLLRNSEYRGAASFGNILAQAQAAKGKDAEGYRAEFIRLVETARMLAGVRDNQEESVKDSGK